LAIKMSRSSLLQFTDRRTCEQPSEGRYLTDGRRLFRVVSQFSNDPRRRFASLEDCLTLEVAAYSPGELEVMRLRPVRAGD
jgi:hypothetical protein